MQAFNKHYLNPRQSGPESGVLCVAFDEPYYAHLLHATFRNFFRPVRNARQSHFHDVYHVILVTTGVGHFTLGTEFVPVRTGHLSLLSPNEPHSFANAQGETTEYAELTFEFRAPSGKVLTRPWHEVISAWTGRACQPCGAGIAPVELQALVSGEIERIVRLGLAQDRDYPLEQHLGLARVCLGLYQHLYQPAERAAEPTGLERVRDYIHKHFAEELSLRELAKLARCTANYLSRSFKAAYGVTPIRYQRQIRIHAAADLLRTTEQPIKRVAELTGFQDVYFFTRSFRQVLGQPPGRYRKAGSSQGASQPLSGARA